MTEVLQCAKCGSLACQLPPAERRHPHFCPEENYPDVIAAVRLEATTEPELKEFLANSARTEAAGYPLASRVENTIDFARRLQATKLGIAACIGLLREARTAQEIFESHGFQAHSVCCKVGSIPKEEIGLEDDEKIRPGMFEPICNPIAQARLLNRAGTELNIVIGLCVGHDSLFFKYSEAPATVLVAKDRACGHNPVAALYTSSTYYRRLWGPIGKNAG